MFFSKNILTSTKWKMRLKKLNSVDWISTFHTLRCCRYAAGQFEKWPISESPKFEIVCRNREVEEGINSPLENKS